MRLGTLSVVTSALLAIAGGALAQTEPDEMPEAPAPTRPLPKETPRASLPANHLPRWQTLQDGYGNYYGGWNDYGYGGHCGGCDSCGGCCGSCRPGICCRLKALKSKLCAAWACRKACRSSSCCSSSCSSCCGNDLHGYEEHGTMSPSDLPTPPPEPTRYDGEDDNMPTEAVPQAAAAPVMKRHYAVQRVTSTRKSAKKVKRND